MRWILPTSLVVACAWELGPPSTTVARNPAEADPEQGPDARRVLSLPGHLVVEESHVVRVRSPASVPADDPRNDLFKAQAEWIAALHDAKRQHQLYLLGESRADDERAEAAVAEAARRVERERARYRALSAPREEVVIEDAGQMWAVVDVSPADAAHLAVADGVEAIVAGVAVPCADPILEDSFEPTGSELTAARLRCRVAARDGYSVSSTSVSLHVGRR